MILSNRFRSGAGYVDRIFKGWKPADLLVQAPIGCGLVINRTTEKALGLEVARILLAGRGQRKGES
jgi:ABC-type uncharacterized transport system substrate-binding protein